MMDKIEIWDGMQLSVSGYAGIVRNPRVEWVMDHGPYTGEDVIRFELESEGWRGRGPLPTFGGVFYTVRTR